MKKFNKKYLFYIMSFFIPITIILLHFIILKINNPSIKLFSSYEILMADMKSQYVSLMHYFMNVLHGKDSILYTFSNSLGGNMSSTYAYYLSSPFNLLLIFANGKNLTCFIFAFILIKIGLSGLTMFIFLNHKIENNKFNALIISLFYALMAYNVSYYFNLMWLDVIYFLPLVTLGIDDIISSQKIKKYIIFLSLSIISNFYISYMLCIFCIIYFIYELIINYSTSDKQKIFKCIRLFLVSSILSGTICAWILIPTILNMQEMVRSPINKSIYITKDIYSNFLMFLSKLYIFPNSNDNVLSKYTPNVYFGLLPFILVFTYFNGKDKLKNKVISIIIILFFCISFSTNTFNLLWHGFSFPNGYAYRFSFLFSFFMLLLTYKSICNNYELNISKFIIFMSLLLFVGFAQIDNGNNTCFGYINIIVTSIFIIIYYVLLKLKNKYEYVINVLISICSIIELVLLVNNSFITTTSFSYIADYNYYLKQLCENFYEYKNINYKTDTKYLFTVLDSFSCNDYRLSGGLTTNNGNLYKFMYNTGFVTTYSTIANNNNTPVMYSLLGINYYSDFDEEESIREIEYGYTYLIDSEYESMNFYIHNNKYALPYGYIIDSEYKTNFNNYLKTNPFEYQNALLKSMSGIDEDCLKPYNLVKKDTDSYDLTIDNDKDIYVYLKADIPENDMYFAEITIDDKKYDIESATTGIFKIKNTFEGETIKVYVSSANDYYYENDDILNFYYLDEDIFETQINKLKSDYFVVTKKYNNKLEGNIDTSDNGTMFLSIPYEKGWNIYIDGKRVNYFKLYNTFIGIDISKGNHSIKMYFIPPGLKVGIIISICATTISILLMIKRKR